MQYPCMADVQKSTVTRMRRSASAEASRRAEALRIEGMSVEERIKTALSMKQRFTWLPQASTDK